MKLKADTLTRFSPPASLPGRGALDPSFRWGDDFPGVTSNGGQLKLDDCHLRRFAKNEDKSSELSADLIPPLTST